MLRIQQQICFHPVAESSKISHNTQFGLVMQFYQNFVLYTTTVIDIGTSLLISGQTLV